MTEFEQRVAEALASLHADGIVDATSWLSSAELRHKLTSRVAAAIDTALYGSELEDFYRQKALAALRGETR